MKQIYPHLEEQKDQIYKCLEEIVTNLFIIWNCWMNWELGTLKQLKNLRRYYNG